MPKRSARTSSESGNAIVELAVCLPLFVLLILGTAELANLGWASVELNNAARAGAAYGSESRVNSASNANIQIAAQNEAPQLITDRLHQVTSTQVCSCVSGGAPTTISCDSSALSNCPSPGIIQLAVQVNTQASVTPLFRYPGLPASYTVNAQATMGVLQ